MATIPKLLAGLQILTIDFDSSVFTSLTARTAVSLSNVYAALPAAFLLKQVRYLGRITNINSDDHPWIFLAPGGASTAELQTAITREHSNPFDPSEVTFTAEKARVLWNSIYQPTAHGGAFHTGGQADMDVHFDSGWIGVGGKGFPFSEGHGPDLIGYNPGNGTMNAAAETTMNVFLRGVWLGD